MKQRVKVVLSVRCEPLSMMKSSAMTPWLMRTGAAALLFTLPLRSRFTPLRIAQSPTFTPFRYRVFRMTTLFPMYPTVDSCDFAYASTMSSRAFTSSGRWRYIAIT